MPPFPSVVQAKSLKSGSGPLLMILNLFHWQILLALPSRHTQSTLRTLPFLTTAIATTQNQASIYQRITAIAFPLVSSLPPWPLQSILRIH